MSGINILVEHSNHVERINMKLLCSVPINLVGILRVQNLNYITKRNLPKNSWNSTCMLGKSYQRHINGTLYLGQTDLMLIQPLFSSGGVTIHTSTYELQVHDRIV